MSKDPAGSGSSTIESMLPVYFLQGSPPPEIEATVPPTEYEVAAIVDKNTNNQDTCFQDTVQHISTHNDHSTSITNDQQELNQEFPLKLALIKCIKLEKAWDSPDFPVTTASTIKQEHSIKSEPCPSSHQAFKGRDPTDDHLSDDEDLKVKLETQDPDIWQDDADKSSPPPFPKGKQPATSAPLCPQKKKRNPPECGKGSKKRRRRTVPEPRRCSGCGEVDICSAWVTNCGHRLCCECYTEIKIEAEEDEEGEVCPECEGQIKWFQCKP